MTTHIRTLTNREAPSEETVKGYAEISGLSITTRYILCIIDSMAGLTSGLLAVSARV